MRMTDILKCNECNIIVDELLCYIQNKLSIVDEETLVRICTSTFTSDEIKKSKTLLFESVPTDVRKILRKNKGKEERDVTDIVSLFKSTEPDIIPIFVAKELDKLPDILMDHLDCSKLLKDMSRLKAEIESIKSTFATQESMNELRTELLRIQYDSLPPPTSAFKINKKRGAWIDSGPMGISHEMQHNDSYGNNNVKSNSSSPLLHYREMRVVQAQVPQTERDSNQRQLSADRGETGESIGRGTGGEAPLPPTPACAPPAQPAPLSSPSREPNAATGLVLDVPTVPTVEVTSHSPGRVNQLFYAVTDKACYSRELQTRPVNGIEISSGKHKNDSDWQTVSYRKKTSKYRYSGKSGVARDIECSFRAAERKIPMFITNVHMATAESDIIKRIYNKTKETVYLERINMKYDRGHKAYKFFISEANLSKYMDETLWPAGVIFRQFVNYKHKHTNGVREKNGKKTSDNG